MKKRILTAAIGIPFGILIITLNNINVYRIAIAVIAAGAVFELLVTAKCLPYKAVCAASLVFSSLMPFAFSVDGLIDYKILFCLAYLLSIFVIMIIRNKEIQFTTITLTGFCSVFIPFSLSSILFSVRDFGEHSTFVILFILLNAWMGDAGAYFVGTFLGKHKMAPEISPKKTWEGFAGGVMISAVSAIALVYCYRAYCFSFLLFVEFNVNIFYVVIIALTASILGVIGDLSASVLKRQHRVKDFGNLFPGHGGILDRFDSVLFSAPFVYFMFKIYFPIF